MWRNVWAFERVKTLPKQGSEKGHRLEGSKAQRGRLDGEIPPYFARLERGDLPVICLRETKRNPSINSELILGFRLVFPKEMTGT